jgi:hypothetical protein
MAENLQIQAPSENVAEAMKSAISTLALAMGNDPKVTPQETQVAQEWLKGNGVNPEVIKVMLENKSANSHLLTKASWLPKREIRKTLELLAEQGLVIPAESPQKPPRLNLGISLESKKTVGNVDLRTKGPEKEVLVQKTERTELVDPSVQISPKKGESQLVEKAEGAEQETISYKPDPSRHIEDRTDLLDYIDRLREVETARLAASKAAAKTATPPKPADSGEIPKPEQTSEDASSKATSSETPPAPKLKRKDFGSDEDFLRALMEQGERVQDPIIEKIETVEMTRRSVLRALAVVVGLSVLPVSYMASQSGTFGSGISAPEISMPSWGASQLSELYPIPQQVFHAEAEATLKVMQAAGTASMQPDPNSRNYYSPSREMDLINEPIIHRMINGLEVKEKKSVLNYIQGAWEVLAEAGYPFRGHASDYRSNVRQFDLCKEKRESGDNGACGSMTGGLHTQGQAFDLAGYGTLTEITPEGLIVKEVLTKCYGFTWGDKGAEKMGVMKRTKSIFSKAISIFKKKAKEGTFDGIVDDAHQLAETNDLVHYQMTKSRLEEMEKKGGVEAANGCARKYLKGLKK